MWFKQVQLFQMGKLSSYHYDDLHEKLNALKFSPCLPSHPYSIGWVSPVDEEGAPLLRMFNGYIMLCLQVEEKILPANVIRQELNELVKQIEASENRKLRAKEKFALKDEVIATLLPRAFSKFTRIYGYIDQKNNWLVLGTTNTKAIDHFLSLVRKSLTDDVQQVANANIADLLTVWLKQQNYPSILSVEKSCVLQDPKQENRIIRCQQQDLFSNPIQALIKDGCEVVQLALCWQDRVNFALLDDLSIRSIQFQDEIVAQAKEMEAETKQQQFDADFLIMTETMSTMLTELLAALKQPTITTMMQQAS